MPLGATVQGSEVNFSLFCLEDEGLSLCLYDLEFNLVDEVTLDPIKNRTGNVWHIAIMDLSLPAYYAYKVRGNTQDITSSPQTMILDPYSHGTSSGVKWGEAHKFYGLLQEEPFDWEGDAPLNTPINELILYEMHVRAFTIHPSSKVSKPGTFLGIIEKIPHLLELGINAVELLPVHEFNESEVHFRNPFTHKLLSNFWGYSSLNFFSLTNRYASEQNKANLEFKKLVKELHKNGIEVILDVVFNHTGEGNEFGPVYSFKGLANNIYYYYNQNEGYANYTGCGNTLNCNNPIVSQMIIDSLRYWVLEMHVDGFRFDLASIFKRGSNGEPLANAPLIEAISQDPILAKTKLIAEPWDAAGLYDVGNFYTKSQRWSEWNGRYRDTIRRFIKGTPGVKADFATSLCGSQDIFHGRSPLCSLNFIVCHDGFTLADLVAYNHKHNSNNGEENRDGNSFNDSWNCGVEGETNNPKVSSLRNRQMKNFHVALMLSQGVPMLHMGDEYGHTKKGNNNTWCQDNELNWFLWDQLQANEDYYRFYRLMIQFRKENPLLRSLNFLTSQDIEWHGGHAGEPAWDIPDSLLAFTLKSHDGKSAIFAAFNAHEYQREIQLPPSPAGSVWYWVVDTSIPSSHDFNELPRSRPVTTNKILMMSHSALILISHEDAEGCKVRL